MAVSHNDKDNTPVPDLPDHWNFGGGPDPIQFSWNPPLFIHRTLCFVGFGSASLETVWKRSHTPAWKTTRDDIKDRVQHVNVVATLLLATISAFCTTEPPANSRILPYTKPIPYCFLLGSLGLSIAGITIGATTAFVIHKLDAAWFREVLMGSRRRIWSTMIILFLPFFLTAISMACFKMGLITAAATSEIPVVRYGLGFVELPPVLCTVVLFWIMWNRPGSFERLLKYLSS